MPLVVVLGCVHIHEDSACASKEQIKNHLAAQLHCQCLELKENGRDNFSGTGKNDTGEFAINVARQGGNIAFHGAYLEPAKGTFSGSSSWRKNVNSGFGIHIRSESSRGSLGTP